MTEDEKRRTAELAPTGETSTQPHPGEGEKPAGVGPVDKKPEIEQQPT